MFLLQLLGPAFILAALGFFLNGAAYQKLMKKLDDSSEGFLFLAYAVFAVGLSIVLKHNLWETPGEIIVSLFGWVALVKGGLLVLSPKAMIDFSKKFATGSMWNVMPVLYLVLGAYVTWLAYFV